jgi:hypothetical protein
MNKHYKADYERWVFQLIAKLDMRSSANHALGDAYVYKLEKDSWGAGTDTLHGSSYSVISPGLHRLFKGHTREEVEDVLNKYLNETCHQLHRNSGVGPIETWVNVELPTRFHAGDCRCLVKIELAHHPA